VIQGVFVAMMTPLDSTGKPNLKTLQAITEFAIENGADGLFPVSTVGGMIHLKEAEKADVARAVITQARGRVPVFAGASASDTRGALALASCYAALGADGCVLTAPYYFPYPQNVILEGMRNVVRQCGLPVILYNIPKYAGEITLDSMSALIHEPNAVGIKDSSGSIAHLLRLLALRDGSGRDDFAVFVGWEEMLLSAVELGGQGCMTASTGIFPEIMKAIWVSAREGKTKRALALQTLVANATGVYNRVFFPLGYHWAMEARGFSMGPYPVFFDESRYQTEKEDIVRTVRQTLDAYQSLMKEDAD
jgi:4-hydroxy-tetrahydrodipicolinate synthase